jgi:hypothetical protein
VVESGLYLVSRHVESLRQPLNRPLFRGRDTVCRFGNDWLRVGLLLRGNYLEDVVRKGLRFGSNRLAGDGFPNVRELPFDPVEVLCELLLLGVQFL